MRAPEFSVTSSETSLSDVLITLRKRRWVWIITVLIGLLYGLYRGTSQPKFYESTGELQVRTGASNEYRMSAVSQIVGGDTQTRLTTEVNVLQSDTLLATVARDLNLANDPRFFGRKPDAPPTHFSIDDPAVRQSIIGKIRSSLRVALVLHTDIIRITFSSLDPKLSADVVNKIIAEYIQRSYETRYASTQRVSQWLSGQLDDLKQQVESSESQMIDAQKRLGMVGLDASRSEATVAVESLTMANSDARIARILAESRYNTLKSMGSKAVEPSSIPSGSYSLPASSGSEIGSGVSGGMSPGGASSGLSGSTLGGGYAGGGYSGSSMGMGGGYSGGGMGSASGYGSSSLYGSSSMQGGGSSFGGYSGGMSGGMAGASPTAGAPLGYNGAPLGGSGGGGSSLITNGSTPTPAPMMQNLHMQLAGMEAAYAESQATLGPNNPTSLSEKAQIEELKHQLALEQERMVQASHEAYIIASNTEKQTSSSLNDEKNNAYKLRDDLVTYTQRQREYEANRILYDGLRQRLRTAGVEAGLESAEIDIVDQAVPAAQPTMQSKTTILIVCVLVGLMVGVGIAFLLESLDTGLSSIAEIEQITELPSLAVIPRARRSAAAEGATLSPAARNITVLTQPKSQFAEAIRSLRTALLLSSTTGHPPKFILFTSATPSEGKTTTSSNFACILAQRDVSVLLIDADLRRPNVHHRFGLNGKVGVSTILTGSSTLENSVQQIPEVPNLFVLPSGPVPPFPTEMITSQAMDDLLEHCGKMYTHVIIDSPPILSVTDGVLLARKADAVALVIRHGKSGKHIVRRARDLLVRSGVALSGIVLNAVDLNAPEYYGYYGYSGYSYSSIDTESWEAQTTAAGAKGSKK